MSKGEFEGRYRGLQLDAEKPALTPREVEVLSWAAGGYTRDEVAQILGTSPHTVYFQMSDIYQRLGVYSVLQASLTAADLGIINPIEIVRARGIKDPFLVVGKLSDREIEVLATMRRDRGARSTREEVGIQLGITTNTIRNHLANIYDTIGIRDEVFAVMLYQATQTLVHPKGV